MTIDRAALEKIVDRKCAELMEHFDAVQIIVVARDGENSAALAHGRGDFYSRLAATDEWVERKREENRMAARNEETGIG